MKQTERLIDELVAKAESYGYSSVELVKLKAVKTAARVTGVAGTQLILGTGIVLFLLMASMGASFWLGELLESTYLGFFAVAGFYLVLLLIVYLLRKWLVKRPIENTVIKELLNR